MKCLITNLAKKVAPYLTPLQKLIPLSLAFWFSHIILRVLLLFRANPYGFPFVSKPDWYIFHAVGLDFLWIFNSVAVFLLLFSIVKIFRSFIASRPSNPPSKRVLSSESICIIVFALFHSAILPHTIWRAVVD